jgi:hypothetical protein
MANQIVGKCPVCGESLEAVRLECPQCQTAIEGRFALSPLSRLDGDQLRFVETFMKVRGNIREMERELGVSYPTVRNRLDAVLQSMGYAADGGRDEEPADRRRDILDQLQAGKITADEAVKLLRRR